MKRIIVYLFLLWIILCARIPLCAQIVDICAGDGTDSVTLSLNNYQYGLIQWQVSADGVLWQDIVDANDTILSFLPKGNGYYRAMISYNNCPYDSSQVSHIMLLPEAYAGPDRMVNAGCMTQLMGNELDGVRAMWEVLEGDDAVIDDVEDPYTLFSGTDSLYKLQWTLANECGVSHDTIEIRYVEPIFYDAIVVVDTTDQIFGDSLERYLGLYRIKFNDPVPVVTDSTILVGIPYGGFLRKVLYVEHRGDTVLMYTKQATLDDVIERGAISFDALAADQSTRNRGLYVRMNHLPTRGELLQNPQYRDGRIRYYDFPMGSAASDNISSPQSRGWNLGLPLFTSDHFNVNANIKISNINFGSADPYFDLSFQKDESGITGFWKVGMERNVSFKLKLEGSFSGTALKVPILPPFETRKLIMVGYIPVEVCLSYKSNFVVKGSASVTSKTFTVSGPYKVGLTLDINENEAKLHPTPPTESITVVPDANSAGYANVDLSLSLDHEVNLKLYEVLGPYFSMSTPKVSIGMCHTINNDDFIHNYHLKVEIPWKIGLKGEIFKRKMFDINYGDSWKVFNWSRPGKVQRYVDNSSDYHNFQVNDIVPVKVQVFGHAGTNLEDAPIAFMPLAEIGGDILNTESDISQIMSPVPNAKVTFSTTNGTLGHRVDVIDPNYGYSGLDFTSEPVEVYANQNGIATAYWKPNNPNFNFIEARVTDCSGKDVEGSPVVIAVDNCGNSDLSLDIVNGELRPSGGSCNNCYEYSSSLSGVPSFAWSPVKPFPLTPGSTYFVRAGTCVASTVCRLADCELDLTHSIQGDHLIATVKNGKKPFQFYLNGVANGSPTASNKKIFTVQNGTYSVKVVDDNGCVAVDSNIIYADDKTVPVVYTNGAYNIQNDVYDDVQGLILSDGNCNITERGIYWSASANMASATKIISNATTDNFVCHIPNVSQGQVLYACAYAVNEKGTGYGDTIALQQTDSPTPDQPTGDFICGTSKVKDHQNNEYNTVQIGNQCWTRENMRCTTSPSTGSTILEYPAASYSYTGKKAYYVNGDAGNTAEYGLLYNWNAAVDTFNVQYGETSTNTTSSNAPSVTFSGNRRGICPQGWHVPRDAEWTQLTDYVSSRSEYQCDDSSNPGHIAKALASNMGWNSSTSTCAVGNTPSTNNATGFSAVPAGYYYSGGYIRFGYYAPFWCANQTGNSYANYRTLSYGYAYVTSGSSNKFNGYSVRCLRDEENTTPTTPVDAHSCPGTPTVTDHEGNVYNTVQIGEQCWTKENMRCTTSPSTGTSILVSSGYSYSGKKAYYVNGNASNTAQYGLLYNWCAAVDTFNVQYGETSTNADYYNAPSVTFTRNRRGICPQGWHVPSDAEWNQLTDYVSSQSEYQCNDNSNYIAKALASTTGWNTYSGTCAVGNTPANNNATGFSAVPAGSYYSNGYGNLGLNAIFWSATQVRSGYACRRYLNYNGADVGSYSFEQYDGYSVRCLRDEENTTPTTPVDVPSCPGTPTVTDHEGNVYNTVQIGVQCWTRENMRCTTSPSTGATIGRYPGDDPNMAYNGYGRLYDWNSMMDGAESSESSPSGVQGICPQGWHVPSDAEWTQLTTYVSGQSEYTCGSSAENIAKALASTTGWNTYSGTCAVGNTPADNNATGFSAVPAGYYRSNGYVGFNDIANFWSATQINSYNAYSRLLNYYYANVFGYGSGKSDGYSVRCLRNESGSTANVPTVTTAAISSITSTTAVSGGNVTSDGGFAVTARGVCWSTSQNPTVSNSHTTNGTGTGSFTSNLTGLSAGTTYYVRAYATNSAGTAYGSQVSFTTTSSSFNCGTSTVTDIDGNTYNTVQIGQQCWMRENMKTTRYSDGTSIPLGNATSYDVAYRYCPDNNSSNVSTYGYLYNWPAVMRNSSSSSSNPSGVQGICPTGWHVPSVAEWTQLTDYVSSQSEYQCGGSSENIAKALASTTGWNTYFGTCAVGNTPANNNATGFSAVPAGNYNSEGYHYLGYYAIFWSATQYASNAAYTRYLNYANANVYRDQNFGAKSGGYSVRCLRD